MSNRPRMLGSVLALAVTGAFASGCAEPESAQESADELQTANCPTKILLTLDKPNVFSQFPSRFDNGKAIGAPLQAALESGMQLARKVSAPKFDLKLAQAKSGTCYYGTAPTPGAPHAELRGSSKPTLDVTYGLVNYVVPAASYSKASLKFDAGATATITLRLGVANDDRIKIGTATVASVPRPAATSDIEEIVYDLEDLLGAQGEGEGRNDVQRGTSAVPSTAVRNYITKKYSYNPSIVASYAYHDDTQELITEQQVAGTLNRDAAMTSTLDNVSRWLSAKAPGLDLTKRLGLIKEDVDGLAKNGAAFGFDGFEQNACGKPTAFLLVIDPTKKAVYGIDLAPCD